MGRTFKGRVWGWGQCVFCRGRGWIPRQNTLHMRINYEKRVRIGLKHRTERVLSQVEDVLVVASLDGSE